MVTYATVTFRSSPLPSLPLSLSPTSTQTHLVPPLFLSLSPLTAVHLLSPSPPSTGISTYLDLPAVRSHLGIGSSVPPFEGCSSTIGSAFNGQMDGTGKTYLYVASLLDHGVKVLIYAGKYDFVSPRSSLTTITRCESRVESRRLSTSSSSLH